MCVEGASNQSIKNIIKANKECYKTWKDNRLSVFPIIFLMKPFFKILQYLRRQIRFYPKNEIFIYKISLYLQGNLVPLFYF